MGATISTSALCTAKSCATIDTVVLRPDSQMKAIDRRSNALTAGLRAAMMLTTGITMNMAASMLSTVIVSGASYTPTACLASTVLPPVAAPAQARNAPEQIAPVPPPALRYRVAAGQQQAEHHRQGAHGDHRPEALPGEGDGEEGGEGHLRGNEEGDAGRPDGAQAHVGRTAPDSELHHTEYNDPWKRGPRHLE